MNVSHYYYEVIHESIIDLRYLEDQASILADWQRWAPGEENLPIAYLLKEDPSVLRGGEVEKLLITFRAPDDEDLQKGGFLKLMVRGSRISTEQHTLVDMLSA